MFDIENLIIEIQALSLKRHKTTCTWNPQHKNVTNILYCWKRESHYFIVDKKEMSILIFKTRWIWMTYKPKMYFRKESFVQLENRYGLYCVESSVLPLILAIIKLEEELQVFPSPSWSAPILDREKERDLTQSYEEIPFTNRKFNNQLTTQKRHHKLRLHNDCEPIEDGQLE